MICDELQTKVSWLFFMADGVVGELYFFHLSTVQNSCCTGTTMALLAVLYLLVFLWLQQRDETEIAANE